MAQTITVNGTNRTSVIERETVEWAESAYLGESAAGSFTVDDDAGTISIPSHKAVTVVQSSSTPTRIYTGYTRKKNIGRGDRMVSGASRRIRVSTVDLNDLLRRRIIRVVEDEDGIREEESITARVAWLLASPFLTGLVEDFGRVQPSALLVDGGDLRGRYPGDLLADMAKVARFNYYVRYNEDEDAAELVFRDDNQGSDDTYLALTDTCALEISNDMADVDESTVFAPQQDAELDMDGEHVYSGVRAGYRTGNVFRDASDTGLTTATDFAERDGVTDASEIESAEKARREADTFLADSASEEQTLPVKLRLRAAEVGLVLPGQRILTRMTHLSVEGWDPARYARILRKRVTQPLNTDNDYDVDLDLSPMEAPAEAESCSDLYDDTPADTYYPLGGAAGPATGGLPDVSDGVVYYFRSGLSLPAVPTPGWQGHWHFPNYSSGGVGTSDYAGSCVQNRLYLMTVGNGTWTIQTEAGGTARGLTVYKGPYGNFHETTVATITPGQSVEVVIDDATEGDCIRFVEITDTSGVCGSYWGWSEAVWA